MIVFLLGSALLISCGGVNKSRTKASPEPMLIDTVTIPRVIEPVEEVPIVEVEEKLVEVENTPVEPNAYFVIIGSFRNPDNAKNFQQQIASDGFTSVLLRNEAGLFRVSVKSTDDLALARTEIRRIRMQYKKYEDTWLLISIK
ncbi:MAG: SPOR domain-containing protein [Candidatus Paceibacterota bacterium]